MTNPNQLCIEYFLLVKLTRQDQGPYVATYFVLFILRLTLQRFPSFFFFFFSLLVTTVAMCNLLFK